MTLQRIHTPSAIGKSHPKRQINFVCVSLILSEEELSEFFRPSEHSRHCRRDAQLDQQVDENQSRFQHGTIVLELLVAAVALGKACLWDEAAAVGWRSASALR